MQRWWPSTTCSSPPTKPNKPTSSRTNSMFYTYLSNTSLYATTTHTNIILESMVEMLQSCTLIITLHKVCALLGSKVCSWWIASLNFGVSLNLDPKYKPLSIKARHFVSMGAHLVYILRVTRPNGRPWAQNVGLYFQMDRCSTLQFVTWRHPMNKGGGENHRILKAWSQFECQHNITQLLGCVPWDWYRASIILRQS